MNTRERGATRLTALPLIEECHMPAIANPHRGRPYDVPSDDFRRLDSGTDAPAQSHEFVIAA
jgi:hypothetical protein